MTRAEASRRWRAANPERNRELQRQWIKDNPDRYASFQRNSRFKRVYGITLEQYDEMLTTQDSKCAICKTDEPGRGDEFFHVDHDHETAIVRGLLCNRCNTQTYLDSTPAWRELAEAYLRAAVIWAVR